MTTPLCFIDTETTGLHPDRRPWEIAVIRRDDHGERELLIQIRDVDLSAADPMGLKVGRFYDRHPQFRPGGSGGSGLAQFARAKAGESASEPVLYTEQQAAYHVEQWTRGAIVVGANPGFDTETLEPMFRRHRLVEAWHYRPVCIESVAYGFLRGKYAAAGHAPEIALPWKSDRLGELLGVEPAAAEDRHTALGDARWVMRMWDAMTGGAR